MFTPPNPKEVLRIEGFGMLGGIIVGESVGRMNFVLILAVRFVLGGITLWKRDRVVNTDSTAPAAPSKCPTAPLLEVKNILLWCEELSADSKAFTSSESPMGVEVAWAFIATIE